MVQTNLRSTLFSTEQNEYEFRINYLSSHTLTVNGIQTLMQFCGCSNTHFLRLKNNLNLFNQIEHAVSIRKIVFNTDGMLGYIIWQGNLRNDVIMNN